MKLPALFKDKYKVIALFVLALIFIISVGGGLFFSNKKNRESTENKQETTSEENNNDKNKNTSTDKDNQITNPDEPISNQNDLVFDLSKVRLIGEKIESDLVKVSLEGPSADYKIQKCLLTEIGECKNNYQDLIKVIVTSNQVEVDKMKPNELQGYYKVIATKDGKVYTKDITVERNLINGSTNFPGAL